MRSVWLERIAIAVCSLALAVFLISLLSGYFTAHDASTVKGSSAGGLVYADQGDTLLPPGSPPPRYDSDPPTSGPHVASPIRADGTELSDGQILTALAAGDVILMYGTVSPPPGAATLAHALAGPLTPATVASGDAVILARRPGARGLLALAWTRLLSVAGVNDPSLRAFVNRWLGEGAGHAGAGAGQGAVPGTG